MRLIASIQHLSHERARALQIFRADEPTQMIARPRRDDDELRDVMKVERTCCVEDDAQAACAAVPLSFVEIDLRLCDLCDLPIVPSLPGRPDRQLETAVQQTVCGRRVTLLLTQQIALDVERSVITFCREQCLYDLLTRRVLRLLLRGVEARPEPQGLVEPLLLEQVFGQTGARLRRVAHAREHLLYVRVEDVPCEIEDLRAKRLWVFSTRAAKLGERFRRAPRPPPKIAAIQT